eukprot:Selendium_serpulae@DN5903_c0_g2_i1.p1
MSKKTKTSKKRLSASPDGGSEAKRVKVAAAPPPERSAAAVAAMMKALGLDAVPVLDATATPITANGFYDEFVAPRRPVLVRGAVSERSEWRGVRQWASKEYLARRAGAVQLNAERRRAGEPGHAFGKGYREVMTFKAFLDQVMDGDLYMTVQPLPLTDNDTPTAIASEPLTSLADDFPGRPQLAGKLEPYLYTFWCGHSPAPQWTTTGMHHDFHDNLYVVVSGRKKFRLYPPAVSSVMPLVGTPIGVEPNGRVAYDKSAREDCALKTNVAEWRQQKADERVDGATARLLDATTLLNSLPADAEQARRLARKAMAAQRRQIADAEREMESLLDDALDANFADAAPVEEEAEGELSAALLDDEQFEGAAAAEAGEAEGDDLRHFCRATTEAATAAADGVDLLTDFLEVEMEAGDILYLPTGWFHEVLSQSAAPSDSASPWTADGAAPHVAMNLWFAPPSATGTFEQPYEDDYWKDVMKPLHKKLKAQRRAAAIATNGGASWVATCRAFALHEQFRWRSLWRQYGVYDRRSY